LIRLIVEHLVKIGDQGVLFVPRAGIIRAPNSWLEPDLFYVADAKAYSDAEYPQYLRTADLVIEVISPSSAIYDRNTKADTYAVLGVKELWLVDEASGIIEVRILDGGRYTSSHVLERDDMLKSTVLSGLEMRVGDVFTS
jgi:Uma2 family endonuclease